VAHHGAALRKLTNDPKLETDLARMDLSTAALLPPDRVLLEFAISLTRQPAAISKDDIDRLREQGFEERAIHDACQVVAYFNYVNRIASGLGIELEERFISR
jgi:uncharacterized peroxidase-related enzyme